MMAEIRLLTLAAAGSMLFDVVLVAHSCKRVLLSSESAIPQLRSHRKVKNYGLDCASFRRSLAVLRN